MTTGSTELRGGAAQAPPQASQQGPPRGGGFQGAPPPFGRKVGLVLTGLLLTSLMSMLDQSIVATAGPTVVGELGGLAHYSWVFTAYMLAFSVTMPLYGKMGDLIGRKPVFLFAICVFLVGSAACGAAQSMGQLIAFRALQGLGGGCFMVVSMAIIGDLLQPRQRAKYQGYFAAVFALANLAGPLVGGLITDQFGWRWAFYVNVPFGILAFTLVALNLRNSRPEGKPVIDFAGAGLMTGFVVSTVLVTSWAGTRYAWGSPVTIGLGALAAAFLAAWLLVERKAREPLVPLRLFRDQTFDISIIVAFVGSFALFGVINFLPLFFQLVSGDSATQTGLLFLPSMVGVAVASLAAGQLIAKTGRYKWLPVASMALALVGTGLLATIGAGTTPLVASGYLAVVGFGVGLSQQVVTLAAQNTAPPRDMGVATSTVGFLRNSGVWFGTAIFGAILNGRLAAELPRHLSPDAVATVQSAAISPARVASFAPAVQRGFAEAYAAGLTSVFKYALPVVVVGLIAAILMKDLPLQRRGWGGGGGGPSAGGHGAGGASAGAPGAGAGAPGAGAGGPGAGAPGRPPAGSPVAQPAAEPAPASS